MVENSSSPDELNSVKDHKLTRRRVMNMAMAIGFSTPVAMNMTVDDVKASDSDEVTVSFDVSGNSKYTVAADRMDWLQRAKKANEHIKDGYSHRKGVLGVGMSGGDGEDNPHVVVSLDQNDKSSEERRGELPEERNGVRIENQEREKEGEIVCEPDCYPESKDFPGGQKINPALEGGCSSSCQMFDVDLDWFGWTTAAHCFPDCKASDVAVNHETDCYYTIGYGDFVDVTRDIGFIQKGRQDPSPLNLKPSDRSEGVKIIDTVSEEGFGIVDDDDDSVLFNYGIGSCFAKYDLRRWNEETNNDAYHCYQTLYDQMITEHREFGGTANDGDSGSLWFVENPNVSGDYYAMGSVSNWYFTYLNGYEHSGPQGFTIYDIYGKSWRS